MALAILIGVALLALLIVAGLSASRSMKRTNDPKRPDGGGMDGVDAGGGDAGGGGGGGDD